MQLLDEVTCPHCWAKFKPQACLWVSDHGGLRGDPKLGRDAERRFFPTRFTADGLAIDENGGRCHRIACPFCHLNVPRACLELNNWIISLIGAPATGKSFYLGALVHTLRQLLPNRFMVSYTDTDAQANRLVNHYEQSMFGHSAATDYVPLGELIPKTQEGGDQYNKVFTGDEEMLYPQPMMFTLRPNPSHPHVADPGSAARVLCLYDNAGESYLAGRESAMKPVTRHLAAASLLLFLFDPTQDHNFRERYLRPRGLVPNDERIKLRQQDTILNEAANRVRMLANIPSTSKHSTPLFVVVTKQDLWSELVPELSTSSQLLLNGPTGIACINSDRIATISGGIRAMLRQICPGLVDAAESFTQPVYYVGVSSLGTVPKRDASGQWTVRPCDIQPQGVEIPLLHGLNKLMPGLFPSGRVKTVAPNNKA